MSGAISDNMQWRSLNAPFNEQGNSLVLRDIETLFLAIQQIQSAIGLNSSGAPTNSTNSLQPTASISPGSAGITFPIAIANGGTSSTTAPAAATAILPTAANQQVPQWNGTTWTASTLISAQGRLLTSTGSSMVTADASVACSVFGRNVNSTGVPAAIAAAADDQVLIRSSSTLQFAQVTRAALANGSATSVIGRSANSTGAVADIAASVDGQVLTRSSGALTWATPATPKSDTTIVLQQTITASGAITIPGGTQRVMFVIIGAGGGGAGSTNASAGLLPVAMWVASSNGGAVSTQMAFYITAFGGGSGAVTIIEVDATGMSAVSATIGAAGTAGTDSATYGNNGGAGGDTTLSYTVGGINYNIIAKGGSGGTAGQFSGIVGGTVPVSNTGPFSAPNIFRQLCMPGMPGAPAAITTFPTTSGFLPASHETPALWETDSSKGRGGKGSVFPVGGTGTNASAGKQGVVYVFY